MSNEEIKSVRGGRRLPGVFDQTRYYPIDYNPNEGKKPRRAPQWLRNLQNALNEYNRK